MTALRLNDPSLAADHIEWELLEGGRLEYSRGDLDPEASWTVVAEDVVDEKQVNDSSTSAHAAKADDTLNQIAYRCTSLRGTYALELSAGVVRRLASPVSADADLVYRFLLACSRPDTSQALGDTFTELCKLALSRFFGGRASVWNIDARSPDRAAMGKTTPNVVSFLAPKIGARVKAVPHRQLAPGGDGGCDLVATFDFNDRALGHLTVLGQCAASSSVDYWRNKIAEPRRFAHNYELTAPPLIFMFIPYVYRSSDGTWQNEANCSEMVLFDRGRILGALELDKAPLPAKLATLLTRMMKSAMAKAKKKAAKKKTANKKAVKKAVKGARARKTNTARK
jgi:hypothetical protein